MLDSLFKFPIVTVDGLNEEKKAIRAEKMNLDEQEVDMVIGEAECPYYDFLCISDRWLPTKESLQNALEGNFDACYVSFSSSGSFIVPWNKEIFKAELKKFMDALPKESEIKVLIGDQDQLMKFFKKEDKKDE